jgi:hypothetical protein
MILSLALVVIVAVVAASLMIQVFDRIAAGRMPFSPRALARAGLIAEAIGAALMILGLGLFLFQCIASLRAGAWLRFRTEFALSLAGLIGPPPVWAEAPDVVRFLLELPFSAVLELVGAVLFWTGTRAPKAKARR